MKITVLAENTSACGLPTEHGLSLYLETNGRRILFDTGQSPLFAENAERLGVDLSAAELCVLSHGHYDHGGGLGRFLEINKNAPVYLSRSAFEPHYNAEAKYIGLDPVLLRSDRLVFTDGVTDLGGGLSLCDCNERGKRVDMGAAGLMRGENGVLLPDDFRHEQYLTVQENGRSILISGCSHKGIINLMYWLHPDVLVGGFHFMKLPPGSLLERYARELDAFDTEYYTCHCTGAEQYAYLKRFMSRLHAIGTGQTLIV